jgi:hypothetical protein
MISTKDRLSRVAKHRFTMKISPKDPVILEKCSISPQILRDGIRELDLRQEARKWIRLVLNILTICQSSGLLDRARNLDRQ